MNELGMGRELTVGWTEELPVEKGFQSVRFDDLPNGYLNDGTENRGYRLASIKGRASRSNPKKLDESVVITEGDIAYRCNPQRQFSDFTDKAHQIFEKFALRASPERAQQLGERVEVLFDGGSIVLDVEADDRMSGDIVEIPDFKSGEDVISLFGESRYSKVTIKRV
jgi:NADH-quinone oxidoreductase subunit G